VKSKLCRRCREMKPLGAFHRKRKGGQGRGSVCKACRKQEPYSSEANRRVMLKHKYGITPAEYATLLTRQGGGCAVCGRTSGDNLHRHLHVDHDHVTGRVRGLLCSRHNVALGMLGDDPEEVVSLLAYIRPS
jgi:hypothetical protein